MTGARGALALLALALLAALPAGSALAGTHRIALVVGNNIGSGARPPLRFAESDAGRLAAVLVELGGFRADDVRVLQGAALGDVTGALAAIREQVAAWRQQPDGKAVLVFYFSGHSDGTALELGGERLGFGDLKRALASTGADVRVAIVDSCQSGALVTLKGATPGPAFDIRFTDDVASSGEALLTSSAAHEAALESSEIRASFFSHHLVSGLRGAADASGDGRVTLAEAYRYAFVETLAATANTLAGPQHPRYDYRLSGQGEVVLTELAPRSAVVRLPGGFDRMLVQEQPRGHVLAEVGPSGARRVAVPPGGYRILAFRQGKAFSRELAVTAGSHRDLRAEDLTPALVVAAVNKGDPAGGLLLDARPWPDRPGARRGWGLVAAGVRLGVARDQGPLTALRLGLRPERSGWTASLDVGAGQGAGFREYAALLAAGWSLAGGQRRLRGHLGLELAAGAIAQTTARGEPAWTGTAGLVASAGGLWWLAADWGLVLEAALPGLLLRRDGGLAVHALPSVTLGLAATW